MHGLHLHSLARIRSKAKEADMEAKATAGQPVYEDFVPSYKLVRDEGFDTLVIELPGFKKEQTSVHIGNFGSLSISGERPLGNNLWSRFRNVFEVPKECNDIHTWFENERLHVKILPKLSTEATMEAAIKLIGSVVNGKGKDTKDDDKKGKGKDIKDDGKKDEGKHAKDGEQNTEKFEIREPGLGFSKPVQILVNLIVAVVVLVVMALYMTSSIN